MCARGCGCARPGQVCCVVLVATVCFTFGEVRCSGSEAARGTSVRLRRGACSARAAGEGLSPPSSCPTAQFTSLTLHHHRHLTTITVKFCHDQICSHLVVRRSRPAARPGRQRLPPRPAVHNPHNATGGKFGNFCPLCCRSWKECAGVQVVMWGKGGAGGLR